ncbi:hypothetical protein MKW92_016487 [Papaver armeniacum]|nr:hypothetical protein MKW92_016487 [Papaver armeniacum]
MSNLGEHNVVVFGGFLCRSMKSLNSEAVGLEADTDDKERDKQTRSIKLVKDQALLSGLAYCIYDFDSGISLVLYQNLVSVIIVSPRITKSGNLNEFMMVLPNNTLSLPLRLLLIFLFDEVDYCFNT